MQFVAGFPSYREKSIAYRINPAEITGFSWLFPVLPCSALQWRRNKYYLFPNIFKCSYSPALQHTAQWDVNVSIGAKDWWHPTTRHNSDFSSLHVVNTQNSFVYHMEGVTSIIFRNFLSWAAPKFLHLIIYASLFYNASVYIQGIFLLRFNLLNSIIYIRL